MLAVLGVVATGAPILFIDFPGISDFRWNIKSYVSIFDKKGLSCNV